MPIGYVFATVVVGVVSALGVRPFRSPWRLARLSWRLTFVVNEVPFLALLWLAAATALAAAQGDLFTPVGLVGFAVATLAAAGVLVGVGRSLRAPHQHERLPWLRIFVGYPFRPRGVERAPDLEYGPKPGQRLDLIRNEEPGPKPVFVYLHGGGFTSGHKHREGRPLLHRLAQEGWLCIDADYRLAPAVRWGDQVDDVRAVLRWVRQRGDVDPGRIVVAGASAGAHLAATVGLTDWNVAAVVGLYGFYGEAEPEEGGTTTPRAYRRPDAPPFVVVHGDHDTYTPVEDARSFVADLRAVADNEVVYLELPGAQHSFDVFCSIRTERIAAFLVRYLGDLNR